jgi:ribosomal protein S18 acetylase RimI-like enzyme
VSTATQTPAQTLQVSVRRMRAEDWEAARCVRLAALADAPEAFGHTLAEEVALSDDAWRERAQANASGDVRVGFLAFCNDVPCGVAVGELTHGTAVLSGMWVAGNVRRHGIGRALVQAVSAWATERGARAISLKVVSSNAGAVALYRANGFEPLEGVTTTCGERKAPALEMRKPLRG